MENTIEITAQKKNELVQKHLASSMSYEEFMNVMKKMVALKTNTGAIQNEALTNFTLLNDVRMKRVEKTLQIPKEIQALFSSYPGNQTWLVITESWCGDAAQSLPIMHQLVSLSKGIDLRIVLRDDHLELMDAFLINEARSIPVLIVVDNKTKEIVSTWGPRPSMATTMVNTFKQTYGKLTSEFKKELQVWYNKDKGQNIMEDLAKLINFVPENDM